MEELFKEISSSYLVSHYKDNCEIKNYEPFLEPNNIYSVKDVPKRFITWDFDRNENTEESYVKNYGNPFSAIRLYRGTAVVVKKEDKITIKYFEYLRHRSCGVSYFKISTSVKFFTYNFKKHLMYIGEIKNYHKKRKFTKRIKIANTSDSPILTVKSWLNTMSNIESYESDKVNEKKAGLYKAVELFISNLPGIEKYKDEFPIEKRFYKYYFDNKGIKLPNNWTTFIYSYPQPKKKDYIKNGFKYIDTIMSINNLKGSKIRKVLHELDHFNPLTLKSAIHYYDETFIMSQPYEFILSIFKSTISNYNLVNVNDFLKNKLDLKNSFEIFKLVVNGNIHEQSFIDHLRMFAKISKFEPIKWKSDNYDDFSVEHLDWTEKYSFYTNGTYERVYSDEFKNGINKQLTLDNSYYPVLLTKSDEYNRESHIQSNCVKGYINRASSLIISLRKDNDDSKERITIEYKIQMNDNKVALKRVQTLGRFNHPITMEWYEPVKLLDDRINKLLKEKKFTNPKLIITYPKGVFSSESVFNEEGNRELKWKEKIEM